MYQLPDLMKVAGLAHGFSTREEGNQGFGFGPKGEVIKNRGQFLAKLRGLAGPENPFHLKQGIAMVPFRPGRVGVAMLVGADRAAQGMLMANSGPECDAMILKYDPDRPVFLSIAVGDCIPIMVYHPAEDPEKRVLALIHASRESTVLGVAGKTVNLMRAGFGIRPEHLMVGIGPGIKQDSYLLQTFPSALDAGSLWPRHCRVTPEGVLVDLFGYNRGLLISRGVRPERIEECPLDTFIDQRFFSHRRSKATGEPEGRHLAVAGMVPLE